MWKFQVIFKIFSIVVHRAIMIYDQILLFISVEMSNETIERNSKPVLLVWIGLNNRGQGRLYYGRSWDILC